MAVISIPRSLTDRHGTASARVPASVCVDAYKGVGVSVIGYICPFRIADINLIGVPAHDDFVVSFLELIPQFQTDFQSQLILRNSRSHPAGPRAHLGFCLRRAGADRLLIRISVLLVSRIDHDQAFIILFLSRLRKLLSCCLSDGSSL